MVKTLVSIVFVEVLALYVLLIFTPIALLHFVSTLPLTFSVWDSWNLAFPDGDCARLLDVRKHREIMLEVRHSFFGE